MTRTGAATWRSIRHDRRQERAEAAAVASMGHPGAHSGEALARIQCAALVNGCTSFLAFPLAADVNASGRGVAAAVNPDHRALELLRMNGWHVDHGKWVCGQHERKPCTCPPGSAAARTGGTCSGEDWCEHCA